MTATKQTDTNKQTQINQQSHLIIFRCSAAVCPPGGGVAAARSAAVSAQRPDSLSAARRCSSPIAGGASSLWSPTRTSDSLPAERLHSVLTDVTATLTELVRSGSLLPSLLLLLLLLSEMIWQSGAELLHPADTENQQQQQQQQVGRLNFVSFTHQESSSHRSDAAGEEGRRSGATPHDVGIIIYLNDLDGVFLPSWRWMVFYFYFYFYYFWWNGEKPEAFSALWWKYVDPSVDMLISYCSEQVCTKAPPQ